jgi:hypothetical protein
MARKPFEWNDRVVYRVAELFLQGVAVRDVASLVCDEFNLPADRMTREQVYPLLREAVRREFLSIVPRVEAELGEELIDRFKLHRDEVTVVYTSSARANVKVAEQAASHVLDLLHKIGERKREPVGLGLGPGRGTRDFCRFLGRLLETARLPQKIRLYAITAGCPITQPEYAPPSFFNLFPERVFSEDENDRRVGLFAETMLPNDEFEQLKNRPGPFRQAFERRNQIDLVVNSMGMMDDQHDLYQTFLHEYGVRPPKGTVGNVQYRPYSFAAPIREQGKELRAVTLFDLEDFTRMAQSRDKHVVLIARQCGACGMSRAKGLWPLLTAPDLKVWSDLIVDVESAAELVTMHKNVSPAS